MPLSSASWRSSLYSPLSKLDRKPLSSNTDEEAAILNQQMPGPLIEAGKFLICREFFAPGHKVPGPANLVPPCP